VSLSAQAIRLHPRVRLPHATRATLRSADGSRRQGELKIVSLTGGLVGLSKPLELRSRVRLRFTTPAGAVRGSAEMLKPVSRDLQPFRFVALDRGDQRKLKATIQSYLLHNSAREQSIDGYRDRLVHGTFLGDLLGYDREGDDLQGVNRDPERNCPVCGLAGHKHTAKMTTECATELLCGDDQTGNASEPDLSTEARIPSKAPRRRKLWRATK
jgi:hypothetical protein